MKIADLDFDKDEKKSSAPKNRIPMIEEVFKLVLNREPSSRELTFYKYGVQDREEIVEKLLKDKEHEEALEKSREMPDLEEKARQAEHRVVQLKQQLEDAQEEIKQTLNLLDEKNKEIAILRREKNDPYNFTHSEALKYIKGLTESSRTNVNVATQESIQETHFTSISASGRMKKRSFLDKVYDLIKAN